MTDTPEPEKPVVWPPPPVGFVAPTPAKPQKKLLTSNERGDYYLGYFLCLLSFVLQDMVLPAIPVRTVSLRFMQVIAAVAFVAISVFVSRAMRSRYPSLAKGIQNGGFVQLGITLWELLKNRL